MAPKARELSLPFLVVSPGDVARLKREVEALDDYLHQAGLRKGGSESPKLPRTSRLLDELAQANKLELLSSGSREQLIDYLAYLSEHAPAMTISFASDPSSAFTAKIVAWLRQNIHPELLVKVGLQPNIAAGCTVRTANHFYDLSLRKSFASNQHMLIEALQSVRGGNER